MLKANGIALALLILTLVSCSKQDRKPLSTPANPIVETFPISSGQFQNCRFENPSPTYSFGSAITPNPIICDQGVATSVQLLTPSPLPSGIQFKLGSLSLVGTANEKVQKAPYQFYIENEAGYQLLKIQITIQ